MDYYLIVTVLVFLSATFGYINARFIKLPSTIGLTVITIVFTFFIFGLSYFDDTLLNAERYIITQIDFRTVLLDVMLSFLLFAGALHTDLQQLKALRWPVLLFATFGVLVSTFLIGGAVFLMLPLIGLEVDLIYCFLFGALISPTDPIAVLGILKKAKVPEKLEMKIVGESLFNDGVGVVIFLTIYGLANGSNPEFSLLSVLELFVIEVGGGVLLGAFLGWLTYKLMKSINDYNIEVILTLSTVMTGSAIATYLHVSAPLAMVVAGLAIGGQKVRKHAMSEQTQNYVDKFWELIDILLNTILFVLIGMELLVLDLESEFIVAGLITIPIALICRYTSLLIPVNVFKKKLDFVPYTSLIMTWGGLRGAISIALALGLTMEMQRDLFLVMTYVVVIFSIIVQGLTVGKLVNKLR
ncbi:cation:proton antiporter [Eudoraea sp.]|uniref:cation:proton antiporter n=2 Tax=Eudoraea sp. TaxID=1979955 RepID=UPI003C745D07